MSDNDFELMSDGVWEEVSVKDVTFENTECAVDPFRFVYDM